MPEVLRFSFMRKILLVPRYSSGAVLLAGFFLLFWLPFQAWAEETTCLQEDTYFSLYAGQAATDRMMHIIGNLSTGWLDSYMVSAAAGKSLHQRSRWRLEGEGQFARHFGEQNHVEMASALLFRWTSFPWDHLVDTRIAFGEGLSWATKEPSIEPRGDREGGESARLLNYLVLEMEKKYPGSSWSGYFRIHHRSGVIGIFGNVKGGSNFLGFGVRYYLQ